MENKNLKNYQISQNFNYIANLNIYYSQHKTHTSHHNIHHSPPSAYNSGITLVALVVTMVLHYDKVKKCSNSNSFLLSSI